jgi:hypothetical protein
MLREIRNSLWEPPVSLSPWKESSCGNSLLRISFLNLGFPVEPSSHIIPFEASREVFYQNKSIHHRLILIHIILLV